MKLPLDVLEPVLLTDDDGVLVDDAVTVPLILPLDVLEPVLLTDDDGVLVDDAV